MQATVFSAQNKKHSKNKTLNRLSAEQAALLKACFYIIKKNCGTLKIGAAKIDFYFYHINEYLSRYCFGDIPIFFLNR